jgi:hypothetical protein
LPLVDERRSKHGDRVWLRAGDGSSISLPRQWTSLWAPDAFELASAGRAWFRPNDLARLTELISRMRKRVDDEGEEEGDV